VNKVLVQLLTSDPQVASIHCLCDIVKLFVLIITIIRVVKMMECSQWQVLKKKPRFIGT